MLFKKDRKIRNLEVMISNRDKLIKDMEEQASFSYKEKQQLKEENADLRYEIDEAKDVIRRINTVVTKNKYENEEVLKKTIKELSSDYQSNR